MAFDFEFRPLQRADLSLVLPWTNAPHAKRGYGGGYTFEELEAEYVPVIEGAVPIHAFIAQLDGRPVGLVEWERIRDFPEMQHAYGVTDPDSAACDILVGERDVVYRGVGPAMIEAFLARIVFADPRITCCVIDPFTDNFTAIRAYEKVGFRFVRAVPDDLEGGSVYLMELRREELGRPQASAPYLRPGRLDEVALASAIDDDASRPYAEIGLALTLPPDHPFVVAETKRWEHAAEKGLLLFACAPGGEPVGFSALGLVDGRPCLEQVSVRTSWMRQGIGRLLLRRAQHWSVRAGELWLTTYDARVPWNEPWYTREGFVRVPDHACGPELRTTLEAERRALPTSASRIAMVYRHRVESSRPPSADP